MQNKSLFYILIINFVILLLSFSFSILTDSDEFFPAVVIFALTFFILGLALIFKTRKEERKIKTVLMITGFSAVSPLLFSILHNFFYALAIIFPNFNYFFEILHVSSFIVAIIIAPVVFIIGSVISLVLFKKKV